jgi:hypothetical protein
MPATPNRLTLTEQLLVAEAGAPSLNLTLPLQTTVSGDTLEKTTVDVPADSTVDLAVVVPIDQLDAIVIGATGAALSVVADKSDEEGTMTVALAKNQGRVYYPDGPNDQFFDHPFDAIHLTNADLVNAAVFYLRVLRNAVTE